MPQSHHHGLSFHCLLPLSVFSFQILLSILNVKTALRLTFEWSARKVVDARVCMSRIGDWRFVEVWISLDTRVGSCAWMTEKWRQRTSRQGRKCLPRNGNFNFILQCCLCEDLGWMPMNPSRGYLTVSLNCIVWLYLFGCYSWQLLICLQNSWLLGNKPKIFVCKKYAFWNSSKWKNSMFLNVNFAYILHTFCVFVCL